MWRLDDHYLEHSHEMPLLDRLPSDYIRDRFYFTTQPIGHMARNPARLATVIEMIGSDCVLFSSDLPHHDFDTPDEFLKRVRSLDDETFADVMGGSAARVYGSDDDRTPRRDHRGPPRGREQTGHGDRRP